MTDSNMRLLELVQKISSHSLSLPFIVILFSICFIIISSSGVIPGEMSLRDFFFLEDWHFGA